MPAFTVNRSKIPLWSGGDGALALSVDADLNKPVTPGASPIVSARFDIAGGRAIAFGAPASVKIGVKAGTDVRITPVFKEHAAKAKDLLARFPLAGHLTSDNVLLCFELGARAAVNVPGAFRVLRPVSDGRTRGRG